MQTKPDIEKLSLISSNIRQNVVRSVHAAKSGHPGGSLGAADILTTLYFHTMNIDPKNPEDAKRDRFVLSKGHNAPALYATLAERGYFPKEDLLTLRKLGSHLQGHPSMKSTLGVDMSTGSLGQGVSAAAGMALGLKLKGGTQRVYTLLGDGEIAEGEVWEAFLFAAHNHLDNLCVIIDINGLQIDGKTADVMNTSPIKDKMQSFGFNTIECNGNSISELITAFDKAKTVKDKPTCVLAKTTKGKGVDFMENNAGWHGKAPNDQELESALKQLGGVK